REAARLEPAAHRLHVWPGTEPDEEFLHAVLREQLCPVRDARRVHTGFTPAEIDAVVVAEGSLALPLGIDGEVAIAERRRVELWAENPPGRGAPATPDLEPYHLQRQAVYVHGGSARGKSAATSLHKARGREIITPRRDVRR